MLSMVVHDAVVGIPCIDGVVYVRAAPKLNEPHSAFDQPTRQQALPPKGLRDLLVQAVEALGLLILLRQIDGLRRARLHAIRQLVRSDSRRELTHARKAFR